MPPRCRPLRCFQCTLFTTRHYPRRLFHVSNNQRSEASAPSVAPKVNIDIKHIRQNVELHEQNCLERNYKVQSTYPAKIRALMSKWHQSQDDAQKLRVRNNRVQWLLQKPKAPRGKLENEEVAALSKLSRDELIQEARRLKLEVAGMAQEEEDIMREVESLAVAIPNLTSPETPRGDDFKLISYINGHPEPDPLNPTRSWKSHVDIGTELDLLDFASAGTTSGWGWYYLLNEAAELEQALVSYAVSIARNRGWGVVAPPSIVYSHIASACGFQPRDQNGEQQVYALQQSESEKGRKPELSLAGTAEIPLAGMKANSTLDEHKMPLKKVGISRSYRAEAGARGVDTKGLYRVHEFTKVELFAWTLSTTSSSLKVFNEMLDIQTEILTSLGLHCRVIEMPSTDLGASAMRKIDIEAWFPSRRDGKAEGWGEVTSVSMCGAYQARRLATRVCLKSAGGKLAWPYTVNGTALAVPRVLAAVLEMGWTEGGEGGKGTVRIPEVLWPYMGGRKVIDGVR